MKDEVAERYGVVNTKGQIVVPFNWKRTNLFICDGMLKVADENEKWGYVDCTTGDLVVPCNWDGIEDIENFKNGEAWVKVNNTWKLIDKSGTFVSR